MNVHFRAFHGPTDWGWVRERLALKRVEDTGGLVAVDMSTDTTVAACILDTWTDNSVNMHLILDRPMVVRHGFLHEVMDYVFNVAGRKVVIAFTVGSNPAALSVVRKIGCHEIARVPDGFADGVDMVIHTLTADGCRYYEPREETENGVS